MFSFRSSSTIIWYAGLPGLGLALSPSMLPKFRPAWFLRVRSSIPWVVKRSRFLKIGGRASRTTYWGSLWISFLGLSMSLMSCSTAASVGVGVGGLYLGAPADSAAATPAETDLVTPSESGGGVGATYSLGLAARTTLDASVVCAAAWGESGPAPGAGAGVGAASWAAAPAAETMRARRKLQARFFI